MMTYSGSRHKKDATQSEGEHGDRGFLPISGKIHNTKPCRSKITALLSAGSLLHAILRHIAERFHRRHISRDLCRLMHRQHCNDINDYKYCCRYDQCIQYTESLWFHKISCHAADDDAQWEQILKTGAVPLLRQISSTVSLSCRSCGAVRTGGSCRSLTDRTLRRSPARRRAGSRRPPAHRE